MLWKVPCDISKDIGHNAPSHNLWSNKQFSRCLWPVEAIKVVGVAASLDCHTHTGKDTIQAALSAKEETP